MLETVTVGFWLLTPAFVTPQFTITGCVFSVINWLVMKKDRKIVIWQALMELPYL